MVLVSNCLAPPGVFEGFMADLARDHTVVTYHPRGFGESDRAGPWDPDTDATDLLRILEELEGPSVLVAIGDGCNVAIRAGLRGADRVGAVVCQGANPLGQVDRGDASLVASSAVLDVTRTMAQTDYRAFLSSIIGSLNPQLDPDELSARVEQLMEYAEPEAVRVRSEMWVSDRFVDEARELGDRFAMIWAEGNPWTTREVFEQLRELLPDGTLVEVENGVLTRPDLTAGVVRGITSGSRWAARTA